MDKKEALEILNAFSYLQKHSDVTVGELLAALLDTEKPKGVVYLLYYGDNTYKIGRTIHLERRLKELRKLGNFDLVCYIPCDDDGTTIESYLHNRFHQKRIYSELYCLDTDDVKFITRAANRRLNA